MRYHLPLSVCFALVAVPIDCVATLLAPHWDNLRVKHAWKAVPENWESLGLPHSSATINLHIVLKSKHENALTAALYDVSTLGHPKYGVHLSKKQVSGLVAPHPGTLELVNSWLKHHGVLSSSSSVTHEGNWLTLTGVSVSKANDLLGASYQLYRHVETKETIVRTVGYSLPAVLHGHVQTVAPTTYFASPRMLWQTPRKHSGGATSGSVQKTSGEFVTPMKDRGDGDFVTPPFLHWIYKSFDYAPAATDRNVLGIAGYAGEYPSPADLTKFMDHFHGPQAEATFTVVKVNSGGYDPDNPSIEGNVDVQYTSVMTYPTPIIYYSTGSGPLGKNDPYISWLRYMLDQDDVPQTISTSYADYEKNYSRDHAKAVCDLFAELGLRGASVLFASGDNGVGKGNCGTKGNVRFRPTFPASCPWVTSIGGTTGSDPEAAASLSSGGFSDYFVTPDYQNEAVSTFFNILGNEHRGLYNRTGRGYPDISAQALEVVIVHRGKYDVVQGTSCAAPIAAGIISLLNDYRLSEGKPVLGFLNPWLYGRGRPGLNDIMSGSNPGCGTDGFSAIEGWDPVTGLGTPDFNELAYVLPTVTSSHITSTPTSSYVSTIDPPLAAFTSTSSLPTSSTSTPSLKTTV